VDPFQERVARIGLGVAGQLGFALAGGHAVQVHGLNQRPTEDVDLFTPEDGGPGRAVELVVAAYRAAGLMVEIERVSDTFVRLQVAEPAGGASKVELAVDWRAHAPVVLDIGPVLHVEDAVAGKMSALFNRFEPRDFIDVDAILRSGRFSREALLSIAKDHDPGFDPEIFAESLAQLRRVDDDEFAAYGLQPTEIAAMRDRYADWQRELTRRATDG
jgi:hypothetical protein